MTKLSSLYGRTVALIAIVFLTSFAVLVLACASLSIMETRDDVRKLEKSILMANSSIREFVITMDPVHAKRTELMLQEADEIFRSGLESTDNARLHTELHLYKISIGSLIEAYQTRGFFEGSGLEGQMRETMTRITEQLKQASSPVALMHLLEIRRREKNYLLRQRAEYQDGVHKGVDALLESIPGSGLSIEAQAQVTADLTGYQHDFDQLVVLTNKVEWIQNSLDDVRDFMKESIAVMLTEEEARAEMMLWIALGLILFSFLFGILYGLHMARGVVQPIARIRDSARKLASGDISEDYSTWGKSSNSDVADLASAFIDVANQIRIRIATEKELTRSTEELKRSKLQAERANSDLQIKATDLAVLVDELEMATQDAKDNAQSRSSFLAEISHEIRTPLNGIIGMASLLNTDSLSPEQHEMVNMIQASGESMLALVNDVLDFSKVEAGGMVLEQVPLIIDECIESTLDMISPLAAEKGIDLSYLITDGIPDNLIGDSRRLKQILVNLLANAVKFAKAGEVSIQVAPTQQSDDEVELQFTVADTGIGIAGHKIDSLFRPFTQADAATAREYGGTGLGLSIARHLTKLMGGQVWANSEVGVGSEFHFSIKCATSKTADPVVRSTDFALNRRVILLNENPKFGDALSLMVERGGGTVYQVTTAGEAMTVLSGDSAIDFVMINDTAEGDDGEDSLTLARMFNAEAPKCRIVLLSSIGEKIEDPAIHECVAKPLKRTTIEALFTPSMTAEPRQKPAKPVSRAEDRTAVRPMSILLVEDNVINQKVALRMLHRLGHTAKVVASGRAALESLTAAPVDVVLMDIWMPGMDGFEATRQIRKCLPAARQPVIVALTADAAPESRSRCLEAGMDAYVTKPIDATELESELKRIERNRHSRADARRSRAASS